MQKSKKRKIYVGILALAIAAFLADRFLLDPPESAPAAAVADSDVSVPRPKPAGPEPPAVADATKGSKVLADLLTELAAAEKIDLTRAPRDAFSPSSAWAPQARKEKPVAVRRERALAEAFVKKHDLMAVMTDKGGGGKAIINGMCFQVGQELDGFRLASVGKGSVVFVRESIRVELQLSSGG